MNNVKNSNIEKNRVILSLGSNLGERYNSILNAIVLLNNSGVIDIISISSIYETEPIGEKNQAKFLNLALFGLSYLTYYELIYIIKSIEYLLNRKKRKKWLEREIDIDIIFYDNKIVDFPNLTIPHKEMINRKFVLLPLSKIYPDFIHPVYKKTVMQLLEECSDDSEIILFDKINFENITRNN